MDRLKNKLILELRKQALSDVPVPKLVEIVEKATKLCVPTSIIAVIGYFRAAFLLDGFIKEFKSCVTSDGKAWDNEKLILIFQPEIDKTKSIWVVK